MAEQWWRLLQQLFEVVLYFEGDQEELEEVGVGVVLYIQGDQEGPEEVGVGACLGVGVLQEPRHLS